MKKTPLPSNLRSIPKGFVYLGRGGEFKRLPEDEHFLSYNMRGYDRFDESENAGTKARMWAGCSPDSFYFAPVDSEIAKLNGHKPRAPKAVKPPERPPVKRGDIIKTCGGVYIVAFLQIGGEEGIVLINLSSGNRWNDEILKLGYYETAPIPKSYLYDKYEVLDRKTVLTLPT